MDKIMKNVNRLLISVFSSEFFKVIHERDISITEWRRFLIQKYGSVAYFLAFLRNGENLCNDARHGESLASVFRDNLNDEIGSIAGIHKKEYEHETWRIRTLARFGVSSTDLKSAILLPSTQIHGDILQTLQKGQDFLEHCGALLFLEVFVVREMTELIRAFERTLPNEFPKDGYIRAKQPHNTHEYWYNHKIHDVEHFARIKGGLERYLAVHNSYDARPSILKGIEKVYLAKQSLYGKDLIDHMFE